MKPLIGINAGAVPEEEGRHHYYLSGRYTNAVTAAGGIPLILPATPDLSFVQRYLDSVQGLILTGGPDVDPALYGENDKLATVKPASALRLNFDLALARAAVERNMPVFGICMGCQVLNVAGGGTLFQDVEFQIPSHAVPHYKRVAPHYTFHHVRVTPGTLLHSIVCKEIYEVNSSHHQSVKHPGEGYVVSAVSEDGIVECIERPDRRFVLGVQWHPEVIFDRPDHLALFRALVSAASGESLSS